MDKIILDLCGGTGSWSKPYKDNGYDVRVITLPQYDVRTYHPPGNVYGILAAPPCDQLSFAKTTGKPRNIKEAVLILEGCLRIIWECQIKPVTPYAKTTSLCFWALENPNGLMKRFMGKPCYTFDPYDHGDDYQKKTHLWGWFNNPIKNPVKSTKPKFDRLLTREIHSKFYGELTRKERRSITPEGFAKAFYEANK